MSDPCPDEQRFLDFSAGRLDLVTAQAFELHLAQCRDCATIFAELGRLESPYAPEPAAAPPQAPKQRLGRYELIEVLGSGGQGVVWRAHDPTLNRQVALKLLLPDLDPSAPSASADQGASYAQRLLREARALAALSHPHILTVYDVGEDEGRVWLATELLSGQTLNALEAPWPQKLELLLQIAQALHAAHLASIVHGDLKPANILLRSAKHAVLADFGLATPNLSQGQPLSDSPLSQTRSLGGTPLYMAPELLSGLKPTPASDQYALCVSAYELLFGMRPFVGESLAQLAHAATTQPLPKPRRTKIPHALFEVLEKGLSPSPHERFHDVRALELALRRASRAPQRRLVFGALIFVSLVALGALAALKLPQQPSSTPSPQPNVTAQPKRHAQTPEPRPPQAPAPSAESIQAASARLMSARSSAQHEMSQAPSPASSLAVRPAAKPRPSAAPRPLPASTPAPSATPQAPQDVLVPSAWLTACSPSTASQADCLKVLKQLDALLKPYGGELGYWRHLVTAPSLEGTTPQRRILGVKTILSSALLLMVSTNACAKAYALHERVILLDFAITPRQPPQDRMAKEPAMRAKVFRSTYPPCASAAP